MVKRFDDRNRGGEHVLEQLSAYIDDALTDQEREQVRAHVARCESCRTEYLELQATQRMIAKLPVMPPPRSFTLTPEMVGKKQSFWERLRMPRLYPGLATGSVAALTLLLLLLVGDLLSVQSGGMALRSQSAPQAAESEMSRQAEQAPASSGIANSAFATTTALAMAAPKAATQPTTIPEMPPIGAGGSSEPAATAQAVAPAPPAATPAAGEDSGDNSAAGGAGAAGTRLATDTDVARVAGDAPSPTVAAGDAANQYAVPQEDGQIAFMSEPQASGPSGQVPWDAVLRVGLAVLGILLGIGAIVARQRSA